MNIPRIAAVAAATALLGSAVPAVAAVVREFHPTLQIAGPASDPGDPAGALGVRGEAIAAFATTAGARSRIEARVRRSPISAWVPVVLSGTFPRAPGPPAVAIAPDGAAVVAWRAPGGSVRAAVRDGRAAQWRVVPVAPGGAAGAHADFASAAVAIDARGGATLVWAERAHGAWTIRSARRTGRRTPWVETPRLRLEEGTGQPELALSTAGVVIAAWTDPPAIGPAVSGAVRDSLGAWLPPKRLAANAYDPAVAMGGELRGVAVWEDRAGATSAVRMLEGGPGGDGWAGLAQDVAAGRAPRVAASPTGEVTVTFAPPSGPEGTPILATVRGYGAFSTPAMLTPGVGITAIEAGEARIAMSGSGRAFVAWLDPEGPGSATVRIATSRQASPWEITARPVGGDEYGVALAAAPGGDNGLALLPRDTSDGRSIAAVDFDAVTRPAVSVRLTGAALPNGAVRWTARIRNPGAIVVRGVRLGLAICCGDRLLSARPAGRRTGYVVTWGVSRIAPGRTATITLDVRHHAGSANHLYGNVAAVAVAPTPVSGAMLH